MAAARRVQREWLDELPAADPRAIRSRRDLARINMWMLQPGIMARALARHAGGTPRTILDLGSGDGTFMLRVASKLAPRWSNVTVILLDQQNIVSQATRNGFREFGWNVETVTADLFGGLKDGRLGDIDIVTANLVLHHFPEPQLSQLLTQVASMAPLFVACETRRAPLALLASRLIWFIGCNDVTRHDAVRSVEAGFDGNELSAAWPSATGWELHEHTARLFTHCFVARRTRHAA
jgi:protein-L-isoaspartate O-methyltransferase